MRYARRFSVSTRWRAGLLPLCAALLPVLGGCHGEVGSTDFTAETPICDASDPTQVVAPQQIALLTSTQLMNMVKLVSPEEAQLIVDNQLFVVQSEFLARFPPAQFEKLKSIPNSTELSNIDLMANDVGNYVRDHFAAVSGCAAPATDACATTYLNKIAALAYRRALTQGESDRFTGASGLYNTLRSQLVNGYQVTTSVEQAAGNSVYALFMSPQLLWRWELGSAVSASPPGVFLTDTELATNLSFFLTDQPPDDMLIAAASAGTLRANLASHVDRILASDAAKDRLAHIMKMYFTLNQLPGVIIDSTRPGFEIAGDGLYADLEESSYRFVYDTMWNGKVMDLITSRKAFLNNNLASMVYKVPIPADATPTNFVPTMLPEDQRSGLLTDAGFITRMARATGVGVVPRGLAVKALFLCLETPPPPANLTGDNGPVTTQRNMLDMMTAQMQVQSRRDTAPCNQCHPTFDPYGLVLDWYDVVGRYREKDDLGMPIDGTTVLPADVGGGTVHSALELAHSLTQGTVFMNCMAKSMLQYGLFDATTATVELPVPAKMQRGCAAAGVANAVQRSKGQSFTDMARAVATSPAFVLRTKVQ
jgi:hypothetical protein